MRCFVSRKAKIEKLKELGKKKKSIKRKIIFQSTSWLAQNLYKILNKFAKFQGNLSSRFSEILTQMEKKSAEK